MITATSNVRAVMAALQGTADQVAGALDEGIDSGLDDLLAAVVPVTPVRTGDMSRGYRKQRVGPGHWLFLNLMDYSGFVIGGTSRQRASAAISAVLNQAETTLEQQLDVVVTRVVRG